MSLLKLKRLWLYKTCVFLVLGIFSLSLMVLPSRVYAQNSLNLPVPGTMLAPSTPFTPALIKGITIHANEPLLFDFIVHPGDDHLQAEELKEESEKLIKYFMAALTTPEDQMWVNLSPYEEDRIVPKDFGNTEMGRDLLAQDYLLKQLTASLLYPENKLGSEFWKRVYQRAKEEYGTTEVPMNTFNKVWIVPEKAVIVERGTSVFIVNSYLKVMLEEDYLALEANQKTTNHGLGRASKDDLVKLSDVSTGIIREIIVPELEREVNQGKTFAPLRQISNAVILATWYKQNVQGSILEQVYINKNKTAGIDLKDKEINQKIYNQYIEAFRKGVYNFIKEDYDQLTQEMIPRKYFSGGAKVDWRGKFVSSVNVTELAEELKGSSRVRMRIGSSPVEPSALKYVVSLQENRNNLDPKTVGEKFYNLTVLKSLGFQVPEGFAILPEIYGEFEREGRIPPEIWNNQILPQIQKLEEETGRKFGDVNNPLILAARSNASNEESMAGLLASIVGVGLNDKIVASLASRYGEAFAYDTYSRFLRNFGIAVLHLNGKEFQEKETGILGEKIKGKTISAQQYKELVKEYKSIYSGQNKKLPQDVFEQLRLAIGAVLVSYERPKTKEMPGTQNEKIGVIIERVVWGNLNNRSAAGVLETGVTISRNIHMKYLLKSQGEDVVSGKHPLMQGEFDLNGDFGEGYKDQIEKKAQVLERHYRFPQQVEFVIEDGVFYALQTRNSELSPNEIIEIADEYVRLKIISAYDRVLFIEKANEKYSQRPLFVYDEKIHSVKNLIAKGLSATFGAGGGKLALGVKRALELLASGEKVVLLIAGQDEEYDDLVEIINHPRLAGLVMFNGSDVSHLARHAKAASIPAIMGVKGLTIKDSKLFYRNAFIEEGEYVVVDTDKRRFFKVSEQEGQRALRLDSFVSNASYGLNVHALQEETKAKWQEASYKELFKANMQAEESYKNLMREAPLIRDEKQTLTVLLQKRTLHNLFRQAGKELGKSEEEINNDYKMYYHKSISDSVKTTTQEGLYYVEIKSGQTKEYSPLLVYEREAAIAMVRKYREQAQEFINKHYPGKQLVSNVMEVDLHENGCWIDFEFGVFVPNKEPTSGSSPVATPGGIDLNPRNISLQTDGNGVKIQFPQDSGSFLGNPERFVPVIINIVPVANIPFLLGISQGPKEEELAYF